MYLDYWRLERMPFENKPDPRFFYCSSEHEEALARLEYSVTQKKQLALVTGEYGSGKTMLAHMLREKLAAGKYQFLYAGNPFFKADDVLHYLLQLLVVPGGSIDKIPENKVDALHLFTEILRRNRQINKHTVIIFDETHLIGDIRVFEEIRVLLNYTFDNNYDVTLILLGQTEVREKIAQLPQFKQRINFQYHLQSLPEAEVGAYLAHRLKVSGHAAGDIFMPEAVRVIFQNSQGLSRTINNIADICLMMGLEKQSPRVTPDIVKAALQEVLL